MSLTLAPSNTVSMEEIDAELDRFNDEMSILGYDATVRFAAWGEPVIEVYTDGADAIEEFWGGAPGFLDDFRHYANRTIDSTSIARADIEARAAWDRMFPGTEEALASLSIRPEVNA